MCEDLTKLNRRFSSVILSLLLSPLGLAQASTEPVKLDAQFSANGLAALNYGDTNLLTAGTPTLADLKENSDTGSKNAFVVTSQTFDASRRISTQKYSWGKITVAYHPQADRLAVDVTITNTGRYTISRAGIELLQLRFPSTPHGYDWEHRYDIMYQTPDALPVITADWGTARLALCNDNLDEPVKFGFRALPVEPYAVPIAFGGKAIPPHDSRTVSLSIRVADQSTSTWAFVHDVLQKFAEKYPDQLKWDDRRPIGSAFLATSAAGYPHNPRGWFMNSNLDTTTQAGRDAFHAELTAYQDSVISHCKAMDAQGVIVWDLEGQEMPHATSYLADPRMLSKAAPEMDAIADEFFKRFTDAGLRTGITIRPTRVEAAPDGGWTQVEVENPVAEMDSKMTYATKRWGCTLFYIDSNVTFLRDPNGQVINDPAMPVEDFQAMARRHKDCLLIPEHNTAAYWSCTAPYGELSHNVTSTPSAVREIYPHAFSVLHVVDGPELDSQPVMNQLISAVGNGDILLFRPWWDDPTTAQIKDIYTQATAKRNVPQ